MTLKGDEMGQVSLGLLNLVLPALRLILLLKVSIPSCGGEQESDPKFKVVKKTDSKWSREAKLCPAFKYPLGNYKPK